MCVKIGLWGKVGGMPEKKLMYHGCSRMGGPRAWKEMQKKQQEFQGGWDQEEQTNNHGSDEEDGEAGNVEKRDIYAEYDIDEETENEKSQRARGAGDTGELPGQEDVSLQRPSCSCEIG